MIDIKNLKNEQGVCPFCGSDDLEYEHAEFDCNTIYYPYKCMKCEHEGEEWYSLKFEGHNVYDEEGNSIELQ